MFRLNYAPLALEIDGKATKICRIVNPSRGLTFHEIRRIAPGRFQPFIHGKPVRLVRYVPTPSGVFHSRQETTEPAYPNRYDAARAVSDYYELKTHEREIPAPKPVKMLPPSPQSYREAREVLGSRSRRKLDRNTYLETRETTNGQAVAVRFHQTDIVTFFPDRSIVVKTDGWKTRSTAERIERYLPRKKPGDYSTGKQPKRFWRNRFWIEGKTFSGFMGKGPSHHEWRLVNWDTHQAVSMDGRGCRIGPGYKLYRVTWDSPYHI
jgi:hypothetical protein